MPTDPMLTMSPSPAAAPPAAALRPKSFYLVGEAERSTRRRPAAAVGGTAVSINGRWYELRGRTATFEQLLRLALPAQALHNPHLATVTYRHGLASAYEGTLTPGDAIPLADGLVVTANATYAS